MYGEGRTFGSKKELSSGGNKEMVKVDSIKCQLLRLGGWVKQTFGMTTANTAMYNKFYLAFLSSSQKGVYAW